MQVIIANIIDFIASMVQIWSGVEKKKARILICQTIQFGMQIVSMTLLGGYTAAVSNALSIVRNIICYKDLATWPVKIILIIVQFILSVIFGDGTVVSWLPFIVCTVYILFMDIRDPIGFKILSTATFIPWIVYFFVFRSYTGAFFALVTTIANIVTLIQMIQKKKKDKAAEAAQ